MIYAQEAEKLHAETTWGDKRDRNEDRLPRNYVGRVSLQCHWPSKWVWIRLGIKSKNYWSILRMLWFATNLEEMLKPTATDLNTVPRKTQHWLKWVLKNVRFLPDNCCCLTDMGNKTFFRITWRWVNQLCHANLLAVRRQSQMLIKCLNGNNPLNLCVISLSYCLWHTWRFSCFERRSRNLITFCVLQSNRHQHGALHLGWTRRDPLSLRWRAWQRQESSEDLSRDLSKLRPDYSTLSSVDRRLREIGIFAVNRHSRARGR
jgi:hypothetical protein